MTLLTRRTLAASLIALPAVAHAKPATPGQRVQFWATASGGETLDGPNGSGNPFATALIETMGDASLDFYAACDNIRERTYTLSNGFQAAETLNYERAPEWRFAPQARERRKALVLIFSNYSASDAAPSLPGAATDGARVAGAFTSAAFQTTLIADPSRDQLAKALADFARASERAEIAAIYATGHGVEAGGAQYVLYGDHVVADRTAGLARAAKWEDIAVNAKARKLNLTLWAGCRNNPFA